MSDNYSTRDSAGDLIGTEVVPVWRNGRNLKTTTAEAKVFFLGDVTQDEFNTLVGAGVPVSGVVDAVAASLVLEFTSDNSDLTFTAFNKGEQGNLISIELIDPEEETLETTAVLTTADDQTVLISVTLAHDGNAITATAADVVTAVDAEATLFLDTTVADGTGLGLVEAVAATPLENGIDASSGPIGTTRVSDDGSVLYVKVSEVAWKKVALAELDA